MSQSLSKILIHLVFSTKNRECFIDNAIAPRLYAYMSGVFIKMESPAVLIGGTEDHTHSLFVLSKNHAPARVIKEVKRASSIWMKDQGQPYRRFFWQNGYGEFSIGESGVPKLKAYILNQKEHHKKITFQDEMRAFYKKYNVKYDERFCWD